MSETKFTAGPWHSEKPAEDKGFWYVNSNDGECGDIAVTYRGISSDEETEARAHLIAAAPELYDALFDVLDAIGAVGKPYELRDYGFTPERAEEIVAVLAKARGEQA